MLLSKTVHDAPGTIVGAVKALSPTSISYHVLPKIFLQLLLPSGSYVLFDKIPHRCCKNDIWHRLLAAHTRKHLKVHQRRPGHPIVRDPMEVNYGCEVEVSFITVFRSATIQSIRRNGLTLSRASRQSCPESQCLIWMYHRSQGCQLGPQVCRRWDG